MAELLISRQVIDLAVTEFLKHAVGTNGESSAQLGVNVLYTGISPTLQALREAANLASNLHARIRIVAPRVVPYPLPLDKPQVSEEFDRRRLRCLAGENTVETHIQICLCRDQKQALTRLLLPHSLVVVGGLRRWWRTSTERIARALEKDGHQVVFVDTGVKHA